MNFGKIINGELEYFVQPSWILGDASEYALQNGYKTVLQNENVPTISSTEKIIVTWEEFSNYITQKYTIENKTPEELETERVAAIPEEISKRQLNLALFSEYNIESTQIDAMIASITDETQRKITEIEWRDGAFVKRSHPMVNAFWAQLGYTSRQLDDLFTFAKDL